MVVRNWFGSCYCSLSKSRRRTNNCSSYLSIPLGGALRRQNAEWGLERLREVCDTVVVLPNERLLEVEGVRDLPLDAAFRVADELLMRSIAGVSEMISKEGVVNLDFQDLRSVMENGGGVAMIGLGEARGENSAEKATTRR